jgi:hypothetical protein
MRLNHPVVEIAELFSKQGESARIGAMKQMCGVFIGFKAIRATCDFRAEPSPHILPTGAERRRLFK